MGNLSNILYLLCHLRKASEQMSGFVHLEASQVERLLRYCAGYRLSLVQRQTPSLRRNQAIRVTQAMQARLCQRNASTRAEERMCVLNQQETHLLQQIVVELLRQQRTTHPCEQRTALITELAETLVLLHRRSTSEGRSGDE